SGQETHFVLAAHTPKPIWVDEKTGQPVLSAQFKEKAHEIERPTLASFLNTVYPEAEQLPTKAADLHLEVGEKSAAEQPKAPAATQASTQKTDTSTASSTTAGPSSDEIASEPPRD